MVVNTFSNSNSFYDPKQLMDAIVNCRGPNGSTNQAFSYSFDKVEKILKGSLDLIQSPSVQIQIMDGKGLRSKGKTLLVIDKKLLKKTSLLTQVNFPVNNLNFH